MTQISRRTVAGSAALAGIGIPLLAACGDDEAGVAADPTTDPTTGTSDPAASEPGGSSALASTSDIEVGGGTIFDGEGVVVTQPTAGEFKAFGTTCSHQGCSVSSVSGGSINCPCHGSQFSIEDGSVIGGPAPSGLPEVAISVDGDSITLA